MKQIYLRSLSVLRDEAFQRYLTQHTKITGQILDKLTTEDILEIKDKIDEEMWQKLTEDYINQVLLLHKTLIDVKVAFAMTSVMFAETEGFVTIIYEEKEELK